MLEAYTKNKSLEALEAQLPEAVAQTKQKLNGFLEEEPLNTRALFILVRCHLLCDELIEAKHTLEVLINHEPDHVLAKTELARICFSDNDSHEAIKLLGEVTSARPEITENWRLLSEYLKQDEQIEASQNALKQYDMIKAFNDKLGVAKQAFANADFKMADKICRQLLQLVPNEVRTLRILAGIARQFGHFEFSTNTLAQCVATRPGDVALGLDYGYAMLGNRMFQDALVRCEKLIELAPEFINTYDLKAEVLYKLGQYEEAIEIYRELSEVPEKHALCLLHLGKVLKTVGEAAEATACYQQAIENKSTLGQAYWELANLKTYLFSDDEIASMQQLLEAGEISPLNKVLVQFALGKALEDGQKFEKSFQHYQSANSGYMSIRPSRYSSQNGRFQSFFTADYFSAKKEHGNDTDAAIFIVGLPRSGSTLVEHILSSHSLVDATQELDEIVSIARAVNSPNEPVQGQYPQSMANLSADQIQELAQRYLDYVQPYRQQAPYFVDKAPHNFHHIGLIKTLFPNAKIIDIRRNPMASGWSLYRQFFSDSFLFSYDLKTIGKYYNDYIELMDHWHRVLPKQILTVSYEDLVNDLPATIRTILQYCGLAFEDACLSFHLNRRAVATPSSEQVRQPLYTNALDHWKNYDEFLSPLKQELENHDVSPAS
jgi:tetratricopeptide (TPR) repeat protein